MAYMACVHTESQFVQHLWDRQDFYKKHNKMNVSTTKGGGSHLMDWHLAVIRYIQIIIFFS